MVKTNLFSDVASVEQYIATYPVANALYNSFRPDWKILVQDFFLSKRTLPLTYDPFFKRIFNADTHPDRLSRLISSILGQEVTVTEILSNEDTLLKGNSLLIMDIVVRLANGSITTVEIQIQKQRTPLSIRHFTLNLWLTNIYIMGKSLLIQD